MTYTSPRTGGEIRFSEGGTPGVSGLLAKRKADSRIADLTWMRDGKVTATEHDVVSEDGKTYTATFSGTDDQGKPWKTVEVWDRQ